MKYLLVLVLMAVSTISFGYDNYGQYVSAEQAYSKCLAVKEVFSGGAKCVRPEVYSTCEQTEFSGGPPCVKVDSCSIFFASTGNLYMSDITIVTEKGKVNYFSYVKLGLYGNDEFKLLEYKE